MFKQISITKTYLLTSAVILVVGILLHNFDYTKIDIAVHDTYYVIDQIVFFYIYIFIFLVSGGLSWLFHKMNRPMFKSLFWIHYGCTIPGIIFIAIFDNPITKVPERYHDSTVYEEFDKASGTSDPNFWITIIFILIVLGFIAFLLNLILAIAIAKRKSNAQF